MKGRVFKYLTTCIIQDWFLNQGQLFGLDSKLTGREMIKKGISYRTDVIILHCWNWSTEKAGQVILSCTLVMLELEQHNSDWTARCRFTGRGLRIVAPLLCLEVRWWICLRSHKDPLAELRWGPLPTANLFLVSGSNIMLRPSGFEASSQSLNPACLPSSSWL